MHGAAFFSRCFLSDEQELPFSLTATQVQGYVTQKLCPRWARFQQLDYQIESHPRFSEMDQEIQSRQATRDRFQKPSDRGIAETRESLFGNSRIDLATGH